jgi:phenylalanyl-tRNA synthetase beta chain
MRISFNWLKDYVDIDLTPQQLADRLTMAGLEVEGMEFLGSGLEGVIVGRIVSTKPHPDAGKLTLCDVDTGSEVLPIVCGARNMAAGDKVALALVGASLPGGLKIQKAKLRGAVSLGMLCSEKELGLANESEGIMILPEDAEVGENIIKAIGLDDWAMEINVTPNRPDCLSLTGIAREAAALTRRVLKMPKTAVKESPKQVKDMVGVEIQDDELCPRYAGRVVSGVKIAGSPGWLKRRLVKAGMRPINNVVDATNYVMLEMGQPLHAFDFDLIADHKIVVRAAGEGEKFTTLDGTERVLSAGMLLICDGARPVALAGVMGGLNSEVSEKTTNIFIESAYFSPAGIRRAAKRLGMHTEASHRFERGTDPEGVVPALDRVAELIAELAGGKVAAGRVDEYPRPVVMPEVLVRPARVADILGVELDREEMTDILSRLQIKVLEDGPEVIRAMPPSFRPDLEREIDMVEEIARIHGYSKIKSSLPSCAMTPGLPDKVRDSARTAKETMYNAGYTEVINYSFINPQDFDRLMLHEDDPRRKAVALRNPLTVEQSVMRTTLVPSLLGNLAWNLSRGVRRLKIFELSKVFLSGGPGLPNEPLRLSGLAVGPRDLCLWDKRQGEPDFFDIKGVVETLLDGLRIEGAVFSPASDVPFLHPGKAAWVMIGGREAGFVGQLHPEVQARYDVSAPAYVFELDLEALVEMEGEEPSYRQLPKYPAVERDVAVIVPEEVTSFSVQKTIESLKLDIIEDIKLFDYYAGRPIPKGRKSLAYTITYRSPNRTLTDEEVNAEHLVVMNALKERLGAQIREE